MKKLRITIGKKSYDVTVELLDEGTPQPARARNVPPIAPGAPSEASSPPMPAAAAQGSVLTPMAGVIKAIFVKQGDEVEKGKELVILEAMKMENPIAAPVAGSVASIDVAVGQAVTEGQVLLLLE